MERVENGVILNCPSHKIEINIDMQKGKTITSPALGSIVSYTGFNKTITPYDVYIVRGDFEIGGRISNYWCWRKIKKDGTLGKKEIGYGAFKESENKYEITITVKKL